jgi:hypothetical protein
VRQAGDGIEFTADPAFAVDEVVGIDIKVSRIVLGGDGSVIAANVQVGFIRSGAIPDLIERGAVNRFFSWSSGS